MNWRTALELGRVSNLPTVWTNVLAGLAVAGALTLPPSIFFALMISMSLYYVGGMYLNDAFDAKSDTELRSDRPIPAGRVARGKVFAYGFAMLAVGFLILPAIAIAAGKGVSELTPVTVAGLALAVAIIFYNWRHKGRWHAPYVMGLCRALIYACVGCAAGKTLTSESLFFPILLLFYVAGLTVVAAKESKDESGPIWPWIFVFSPAIPFLKPAFEKPLGIALFIAFYLACVFALIQARRIEGRNVKSAVMMLIAGISLFDALVCYLTHHPYAAVACVGGFIITLLFQRKISGT